MTKIRLLFLLLLPLTLFAQEYNRTDDKGRRQGPWVDFHANGQKRYEGQFKNDLCVGEFKYYDEQGRLQATNQFDKSGTRALNKQYASNGTLIATGYYLNQKKEGEWQYFSKDNGKLILVEENRNGKVHGASKVYYDTGVLMTECHYENGLREGEAKTYYPSGALKEKGLFLHGEKSGIWTTYNEDGDVISTENYTVPTGMEPLRPQ